MKNEYPVGFVEFLRTRFRYDPLTGSMEQLVGAAWKPIKMKHPKGYWLVSVAFKGKSFQMPAARVAFVLHHNRWPSRLLYKDNDNTNMKMDNLTEADKSEIVYERVVIGQPVTALPPVGSSRPRQTRSTSAPINPDDPLAPRASLATGEDGRDYYREMMEAVAQQQRWEHRCLQASPLELELDSIIAKGTEEWEQRRWQDGLVTGYSLREVMLFFEASTYMLPPRSAEWCYMEYKRRKLSGTEAEEGKLVHDQLYSGFLLYAVDKNILSREQANLLLSNYRWRGQQVTNSLSAYLATLEREFLAKHGYPTRAAIREEVVRRLKSEEAERNHQALWADEGVPAALWQAQVLAAEDDQLDPPVAAVL